MAAWKESCLIKYFLFIHFLKTGEYQTRGTFRGYLHKIQNFKVLWIKVASYPHVLSCILQSCLRYFLVTQVVLWTKRLKIQWIIISWCLCTSSCHDVVRLTLTTNISQQVLLRTLRQVSQNHHWIIEEIFDICLSQHVWFSFFV